MIGLRFCAKCGADLRTGSPEGLCPKCMLGRGLDLLVQAEESNPAERSDLVSAPATPFTGVKLRYFGDYELLEEIARGGMGVVFKARQVSLNRLVALKLISGGTLATPELVKRFKAEAEAAASLAHPNIVPIFEIGEHQGQHYFSMGLIQGPNLGETLAFRRDQRKQDTDGKSGGSLRATEKKEAPVFEVYEPRQAAQLLCTVARAVHYAHQRGVLHRDIKPSNILLDSNGVPHLTDFGLAKLIEKESTLTYTNAILGTPAYMSPEQARGQTKEVTTAADVYGLGAVLYETLTGSPPFAGGTTLETIRQVLEQEPRRPSIFNPKVDRDLETICLKCLDKETSRRYGSAEALADDLERWLEHEPILALPIRGYERLEKWVRRQPVLAATLVLLHLVFALGIGGVFWQWWRAETQLIRAERAEADALLRLHETKLNYVRANQLTGRPGMRFDSLAEVAQAAALTNSLDLRNEAIACLVLPDARLRKEWGKTPEWNSFQFDATHRSYVTNDATGLVTVREVETDKLMAQIPGQGGKDVAQFCVFSPDNQWLIATDSTRQTDLWDWALQSRRIPNLAPNAQPLMFTPDSGWLVVQSADDTVHLINILSGIEEKTLRVSALINRNSIHFSPAGDKFLIITNGVVAIYRLSDGSHLRTITAPQGTAGPLGFAAWHPDGGRVACSWLNHIGLWDVENGHLLARLEGHESQITALAFTRDWEYLLSTSWDGTTRFWNVDSQREALRLPDSGNALSISSDNRRLSFHSWDHRTVKLYEIADLSIRRRSSLPPPARRANRFTAQAIFNPGGEFFAAVDSDAIYLFRADDANRSSAQLPVPDTGSVAFAPDGSALFTGGAQGAQLWPLKWSADGREVHVGPAELLEPTRQLPISWVEISHDGQWLLAQGGQDVLRFRTAEPFEIVRLDKTVRHAEAARLSPDGQLIVTIPPEFDRIQIWKGPTGELVTNIPARGPWQCELSADGQWLVGMLFDSMTVWRTSDWSVRYRIPHSPVDVRHGLALSRDGSMIATFASDWKVRLLRFDTGEELAQFPAGRLTTAVLFNSTGDRVTFANESGYCHIWDLRRVRAHLASMNLDWNLPSYSESTTPAIRPFQIIVHTN